MTKISIVTPTQDREHHLRKIWNCVRTQTVKDFEWVVDDGSAQESKFMKDLAEKDDRVRYLHRSSPPTIGAKRNALVGDAQGEFIVHFDDDDYYVPAYVEEMLSLLAREKAAFVKLFGFYLYHQRSQLFGYWDLEVEFPLHYIMDARRPDLQVAPKRRNAQDEWGYGFSYVYERRVWEANPFPDLTFGEDQPFASAAIAKFPHAGMQDKSFLMVHVIHETNMSVVYPQQLLPFDLRDAHFRGFQAPLPNAAAAGP